MTWVPWKPQGRFRVCLPHRVLGTPPDTLIFPKFPMVLLKGDPASLPSAFQNQLPTWKHLLRLTYTATTVTRLNETLIIPDHIMCHMKTSDPAMGTYKSPSVQLPQSSKSVLKLNPFRRIAKTARINLNRYWGLLSKLQKQGSSEEIEVTFAAEMEQNRINELLEAHAHASSQNSVNSQWEEDYYGRGLVTSHWESNIYGRGPLLSFHHETVTPSPQPMRRLIRTAKRSLHSSPSSPGSHSLRNSSSEEASSQDSLFI